MTGQLQKISAGEQPNPDGCWPHGEAALLMLINSVVCSIAVAGDGQTAATQALFLPGDVAQ